MIRVLEYTEDILNRFESILKNENYESLECESYGYFRPSFYLDMDEEFEYNIDLEPYINAFLETIDLSGMNYSDGIKELIRLSHFGYLDDKIVLDTKRPFGNSNYVNDIVEYTGCKKEDALNVFGEVNLALRHILCNKRPSNNLLILENQYGKYQIIDKTQFKILKDLNII